MSLYIEAVKYFRHIFNCVAKHPFYFLLKLSEICKKNDKIWHIDICNQADNDIFSPKR